MSPMLWKASESKESEPVYKARMISTAQYTKVINATNTYLFLDKRRELPDCEAEVGKPSSNLYTETHVWWSTRNK